MEIATKIQDVLLFFFPFLFALCFHEFAHGFVARLKGDRTAEMMGRLTLNPMAHADPIGTFLLPIISILTSLPLFGWAKPVPVDPRNLKRPRQDMFWIAAAGPLSNFFLALIATFVFAALFVTYPDSMGMLQYVLAPRSYEATQYQQAFPTLFMSLRLLFMFVQINVVLAIFNLIPIHPLDGGKVIARFLPEKWNRFLEEHQTTLSMFLFVFLLLGLNILSTPVWHTIMFLMGIAESIARMVAG